MRNPHAGGRRQHRHLQNRIADAQRGRRNSAAHWQAGGLRKRWHLRWGTPPRCAGSGDWQRRLRYSGRHARRIV